jgi:hypothetical protein
LNLPPKLKPVIWTDALGAAAAFKSNRKTGNVLSTIKSQSFRKKRTSVPDFLKLTQILREMISGLE